MTDAIEAPAGRTAAAAVALKLAGASYQEIADALSYANADQARLAVEKDLAARAADADPAKREILRATQAGRMDRLLRGVWSKATNANDPEHLPAARVAMSIIDRQIRLYGLDAPTEIAFHNPTLAEIDAWVATVVQTGMAHQIEEADVIVLGEVVG